MIRIPTLLGVLLLLSACGVPADEGDGFGHAADGASGGNEPADGGDTLDDDGLGDDEDDSNTDEGDDTDPSDDEDTGPGDDEDIDTEVDTLGWEPLPQDASVGTLWVGRVDCGLLDSFADLWMEKTEDGWEQTGFIADHPAASVAPHGTGLPFPEIFDVCFDMEQPDDNSVIWEDDGSFHFFGGDWDHHLHPMEQENRWLGTVAPMFNVSDACLDGLAELGLELPVTLSVTHLGTWE